MKSSSRHLLGRPLATALVLCLGIASAHAADTYNVSNHQLTSPSLTICNATYSDIVLTIAGVASGPTGTTANGSADTFNPAYNLLTVPEVSLGGKDYFNVVASVSGLVSVSSVSGADIYDGQNLDIAAVQVGGTVYTGTVIKVGSIVSVGGGLPKGVRDLYNVENGQLFIPAVQDTVNGKVYTNITVTVASILSIGAGGNPPACGAGGTMSALTAAQVNAAATAVETYYQSLPHSSVASDLTGVAGYMVQSGLFLSAQVTPGGISSTLPDGMDFLEFTDHIEDPGFASGVAISPASQHPGPDRPQVSPSGATVPFPLSAPNSHEIAFLVNMNEPTTFSQDLAGVLGTAWQHAGFMAPDFGVDVLDVTLDNIVALGSGHPFDLLKIDTHGMVFTSSNPAGTLQYNWASTTPITDANTQKYATEFTRHWVHYAGFLVDPTTGNLGARGSHFYSFSPEFLTNDAKFNPGAIVDNQACYGQNSLIAASVQSTLKDARVGQYMGWTFAVRSSDSDQSDAFLYDRLLGEANTASLNAWVVQRSPVQRAFPLSDVLTAMGAEVRNPVLWPGGFYATDTYLQGCYGENGQSCTATLFGPAPIAFVPTTLDATTAGGLVEYSLPSISSMSVQETLSGGTLTINGTFPATAGKAQITDVGGVHPLTPSSWTATAVQVPLPPGGNGASGLVQVFSADGIPSNPVPLTEWKGPLTVTVDPVLSNMNGITGTGGGTITATNNLDFRADVHPVVTTIDTAPQPQNFAISGLMGDSTMTLTSATLSFSGNGKSAQWSLADPGAVIPPSYAPPTPSANTFVFAPNSTADEPATCNTGVPGPQSSGPTTVFCPYGGVYAAAALLCSDNGGGLCKAPQQDFEGYYGYPAWVAGLPNEYDGLLVFTLNPTTYAVTFSTTPASLVVDYYFSTDVNETVTLAATIQPPLYAPTAATPAVVTTAGAATNPVQRAKTLAN